MKGMRWAAATLGVFSSAALVVMYMVAETPQVAPALRQFQDSSAAALMGLKEGIQEGVGMRHRLPLPPAGVDSTPVHADIRDYLPDPRQPRPSPLCVGKNYTHPMDANVTDWEAFRFPSNASGCDDPQFTSLRWNAASGELQATFAECGPGARLSWGQERVCANLEEIDGSEWCPELNLKQQLAGPAEVVVNKDPTTKIPGVHAVFSQCRANSTAGGAQRFSNLHLQPVPVEPAPTATATAAQPSVLLVVLDATSTGRFRRLFTASQRALLQAGAFYFNYTSVVGKNTMPNVDKMYAAGGRNIFREFRNEGGLTSVMEDYCPDHGTCSYFPYPEYKVCSGLFCNFGGDIKGLYHHHPYPGCYGGRVFAWQHADYIRKLWRDVYPGRRRLHVSQPYGCHSDRDYYTVCKSNDEPLAAIIEDMQAHHANDTFVIITSDHGFHSSTFNDEVAGEYEHRHPLLVMIPPKSADVDTSILAANTGRFVTHMDLHKTILGLAHGVRDKASRANPSSSASAPLPAYDLLTERVPEQRSCRDAGIPDAWCGCFVRRTWEEDGHLDHQTGVSA